MKFCLSFLFGIKSYIFEKGRMKFQCPKIHIRKLNSEERSHEAWKAMPSSKAPYPHTADAWGGQHLVTSLAFATALLVIISLLLYQGGCLLWLLDLKEA